MRFLRGSEECRGCWLPSLAPPSSDVSAPPDGISPIIFMRSDLKKRLYALRGRLGLFFGFFQLLRFFFLGEAEAEEAVLAVVVVAAAASAWEPADAGCCVDSLSLDGSWLAGWPRRGDAIWSRASGMWRIFRCLGARGLVVLSPPPAAFTLAVLRSALAPAPESPLGSNASFWLVGPSRIPRGNVDGATVDAPVSTRSAGLLPLLLLPLLLILKPTSTAVFIVVASCSVVLLRRVVAVLRVGDAECACYCSCVAPL
mmetsp:Transcript_3845/g.10839  ORF Transcript_3845/g.10839 Transcript_3845/m.10839 type:complete len:256 (-) Transcript_3845:124-891(-)